MAAKGSWLGIKVSFFLALIYAILLTGFFGTYVGVSEHSSILNIIATIPGTIVLIMLFGSIPAVVLGIIIGCLIGGVLVGLKRKPTRTQGTLIGLLIAGGVVLLVNAIVTDPVLFLKKIGTDPYPENHYWAIELESYMVLLGIPSLVCLGAGAWMGRRLATGWVVKGGRRRFGRSMQVEPPNLPRLIRRMRKYSTRYEIDTKLLRHGYAAEEIETAWHSLQQPRTRRRRLARFARFILKHWPIIGLYALSILIFLWKALSAA